MQLKQAVKYLEAALGNTYDVEADLSEPVLRKIYVRDANDYWVIHVAQQGFRHEVRYDYPNSKWGRYQDFTTIKGAADFVIKLAKQVKA